MPSQGLSPAMTIPATLQDSLMARLDRLVTAKGLAQLGATLGRQFSYALLQAVAQLDEETLQRELQRLVTAELLYQRGVPPQAVPLQTRLDPGCRLSGVAEEYAPALPPAHCPGAGNPISGGRCDPARTAGASLPPPRAVPSRQLPTGSWRANTPADRSAHLEAISHCTTGIELLKTLPETQRTQQALTLYIALGAALLGDKGTPRPGWSTPIPRARALCQQAAGDATASPGPVWAGGFMWHSHSCTRHEIRRSVAAPGAPCARPALAVIAHHALGWTWFCLGALPTARRTWRKASHATRQTSAVQQGSVLGKIREWLPSLCAMGLWLLGYPEQALARLHEALALAHALSHPYSLAFAQSMAAWVSQLRRDVPAVHERHAEACIALSTPQGFPLWAASGAILRAWALAMQAQDGKG